MLFKIKQYLVEEKIFNKDQVKDIGEAGTPFNEKKAREEAKLLGLSEEETTNYVERKKKLAKKTPKEVIQDILIAGEARGERNTFQGLENYKSWGPTFQRVFMESIDKYGYDTADNQFIQYAKLVSDTPIVNVGNSSQRGLQAILDMLREGDLKINIRGISPSLRKWLTNEKSLQADDPEYKVKALTFLTNGKAGDWGDTATVPQLIDKILESNKKVDIVTYLREWQTKDGSRNNNSHDFYRRRVGEISDSKIKRFQDQILKTLKNKPNINKALLNDIINNLEKYIRKGDKVETVLGRVMLNLDNNTTGRETTTTAGTGAEQAPTSSSV